MLAGELMTAGVSVDPGVRIQRTSRIWALGQREFARLREEIGVDLTAHEQPCIRSLGVGAALTEFAISGIPLTRRERFAVMALGGLAILMVSAVDSALDRGLQLPCLFPLDLKAASSGRVQSELSFIRSAVNLYFRRLAALPRARTQFRRIVETAIERMYAAELESVSCPNISRRAWWRKNVLPIAILGIPAWIVAERCSPADFRRHLAWLCRLGEFFGWLDDFVNYSEDQANSHANRIDTRLQFMSQSQLVRAIAGQAKRVLAQWDAVNPAGPARDYFAVVVWGWIEHKRVHASS